MTLQKKSILVAEYHKQTESPPVFKYQVQADIHA